jgi:hypothetical protein
MKYISWFVTQSWEVKLPIIDMSEMLYGFNSVYPEIWALHLRTYIVRSGVP